MGDSGFEPLTSSASKKRDSFLDVSTTYKIPAHADILALALFPIFQNMRLGCCTQCAFGDCSNYRSQPAPRMNFRCLSSGIGLGAYGGPKIESRLEQRVSENARISTSPTAIHIRVSLSNSVTYS